MCYVSYVLYQLNFFSFFVFYEFRLNQWTLYCRLSPVSFTIVCPPVLQIYISALRSSELELWCSSAFFESSIPFILTHKMLPLFLHFLLFINACSFLSFPSYFLFPCFPLHGHVPFHSSSYHHKVAQGRV